MDFITKTGSSVGSLHREIKFELPTSKFIIISTLPVISQEVCHLHSPPRQYKASLRHVQARLNITIIYFNIDNFGKQ